LQGAGGIGGLLARTDNTTLNSQPSTSHSYYHSDGNGNVTALVNGSGQVVARYNYDPYGNLLAMSGPLAEANLYRFSSKESDAKSGLYYYGYRFYAPNLQRWLNRDPIEEQGGINLYEFVGSNPIGFFDAFGLSACSDFVDSLVSDFNKYDSREDLGKDWLDKRNTTLKDFDGFKDELVGGGQGGAVSRHIYGHGGAVLRYGALGKAASYANQGLDWAQRFQKGRSKEESEAEIASNKAARQVADDVQASYKGDKDSDKLRDKLNKTLCQ
jgi:RHS repeat-associated protein